MSKFTNFSVLLGCLFSSCLFELRFLSFDPPVPELRNQIVGGASQSAPTLYSIYSLLLGHSSGDLWTASEYASMTYRLPHVAGVPTGRSLARSPPAATGMVARLNDNLQLLAPVLRFHLQASSKRTHAYTTRSHRTPPVGVQSQGTHNQQFTRPDAGNRTLACKN